MRRYRVTISLETEYSTIVEAENEDKAIEEALERDAPSIPAYFEDPMEYEWVSEPLCEFPNQGNKTPDVSEED